MRLKWATPWGEPVKLPRPLRVRGQGRAHASARCVRVILETAPRPLEMAGRGLRASGRGLGVATASEWATPVAWPDEKAAEPRWKACGLVEVLLRFRTAGAARALKDTRHECGSASKVDRLDEDSKGRDHEGASPPVSDFAHDCLSKSCANTAITLATTAMPRSTPCETCRSLIRQASGHIAESASPAMGASATPSSHWSKTPWRDRRCGNWKSACKPEPPTSSVAWCATDG